MSDFRIEKDSLGEVRVPSSVNYGAQTQRALDNFPISGIRFSRSFIKALGIVKRSAAEANRELGLLPDDLTNAIVTSADRVIDGEFDDDFVLDIYQTGSGTSSNMNANEVIANLASESMGGDRGSKLVHPNDHVNMSQSSNDVIPTAMHVAASMTINDELVPALKQLASSLDAKATEFDDVLKSGRTHLMDATPVRLGQEFGGYAAQIGSGLKRLSHATADLAQLALGGTAVGTGINRHPNFPRAAIAHINSATGLQFSEAENHFEAQASPEDFVRAHGVLALPGPW